MAIISFRHNFIFIKTKKTAGSSLEVHFGAQCGPEDIVTPINPPNPGHQPRNFRKGRCEFANHMPARRIRRFEPEAFASSFKFCFERHPVDKCLSQFAMLKNSPHFQKPENPESWEDYLERGEFPVDDVRYTDSDGALIVDRIFRYEDLPAALVEIERAVGVSFGPFEASEKSGYRYDVPSFDEVMADRRQRRIIFDAFAPSLRHVLYE